MSIKVEWDNEEKTIIRYDYGPGWTWEDFRVATETSNQMVASVGHVVDFITDFSGGSAPPVGALAKFKAAQENSPANVGLIVIVGGGTFVNTLVSAFSRVYKALGERLVVAGSVEEARTLLAERRGKAKSK